jgi:hypothetical protein
MQRVGTATVAALGAVLALACSGESSETAGVEASAGARPASFAGEAGR